MGQRNCCAMSLTSLILKLLLLAGTCVCSLERVTHRPENNIICPQTLSNCRLGHTNPLSAPDVTCCPASVCHAVTVKPKLCCYNQDCKPCFWINIQLSFIEDSEDVSDGSVYEGSEESSGDDSEYVPVSNDSTQCQMKENFNCEEHTDDEVTIAVCYQSAESNKMRCKRLDFTVDSSERHKHLNLTLVEYEDVHFGRKMTITVGSKKTEAEVPTLKTVCSSPDLKDIQQCKGLRIQTETHKGLDKMILIIKDEGASRPLYTCMKRGREGKCWPLPNNSIPLASITDCICFQAWKQDSERSEICPFESKTEFRANVLRNTSVSVVHMKTNNNKPMLSWNLTSPCRIKAELWPCLLQADGECREVNGFRQQCCNTWTENSTKLWASGTFVNIRSENQQPLCVMLKVDGEIVQYCQHPLERQYWSLLLLLPLIVVCLTVVGGLLLVNKIKWYLSEWDRCYSQDTRGQVLLLHSPATNSQLVCKLGQLLSELGFGVFLDLWNPAELGSRGPAAWLHSKLDHIKKHGGKALLLLSQSTLQRAKLYWEVAVEGQNNPETNCSDTLGSALGCIFADRQKGGALQRFILVQIDSPELLINEENDLPKLLRGLPLYKLPSQAQGLLTELCLEKPNNVNGKLKKMWWMKRAQSKLATGMQNFWKMTRVRTESMNTQTDSLSVDMEDTEERVCLRHELH